MKKHMKKFIILIFTLILISCVNICTYSTSSNSYSIQPKNNLEETNIAYSSDKLEPGIYTKNFTFSFVTQKPINVRSVKGNVKYLNTKELTSKVSELEMKHQSYNKFKDDKSHYLHQIIFSPEDYRSSRKSCLHKFYKEGEYLFKLSFFINETKHELNVKSVINHKTKTSFKHPFFIWKM